jgi:hypothetical protein
MVPFAALHVSLPGTELPIPNVLSSVANGGKADKICSMRVLRILTHLCHSTINFAVMHKSVLAQRRGNLQPSG